MFILDWLAHLISEVLAGIYSSQFPKLGKGSIRKEERRLEASDWIHSPWDS